jgi:hypothetical protein
MVNVTELVARGIGVAPGVCVAILVGASVKVILVGVAVTLAMTCVVAG